MGYAIELVGQEFSQGQNPTGVNRYQVMGTDDRTLARMLADAASPLLVDGLVKQQIHVTELGGELWEADVQYGTAERGEPGSVEWSLEIGGGGSQHITQSLETIQRYPAGARNFHGALLVRGQNGDLQADGIDIDVTRFAWSETHHFEYSQVGIDYLDTLFSLRGKVNDADWRIFSKGEVRFMGVSGSGKGEYTFPLTFQFEASPNATGLTVGDITGVDKEGWQYLWVFYEKDEDLTADGKIIQPAGVYVEKVYEYGDFDALGLDNPWS